MANRTVKDAHTVKGTNPQYLVEKIIRFDKVSLTSCFFPLLFTEQLRGGGRQPSTSDGKGNFWRNKAKNSTNSLKN